MKRSLPLAVAWLSLVACSSDEPGPDAGGNRLRSEGGFCAEWARVACHPNVLDACESEEDICRERQQTFCENLIPADYAPTHAEDCIAAVKTAYSDATLTAEEASIVLHLGGACSRLVDGGRAEGDACSASFDCDTVHDFECVIKPGDSAGTCQVPTPASGGERCDDPEVVCDAGNYCDGRNCLAVLEAGETCANDAMCVAGHVCLIPTAATEGTCEPKLELRAACTSDYECESGFCVGPAGSPDTTCRGEVNLSPDTPFCADLLTGIAMAPSRVARFLPLLVSLGCDTKPKPAPPPAETAAPAPTPTPTPSKPTLPPTLVVNTSGALVAGTRVTLDGTGALDRLKTELEAHRSFLEKQEVRVAAERKVKPAYVGRMLEGLGAVGASRVLIRTSSRADFPNEVGFIPPDRARAAPACSVVAMILADRSTAAWHLNGGVAGRRGKGMAGPDLTLTGETIRQQAKSCKQSNVLFVAGADGVDWGLVYDLAASSKTFESAYFADAALVSTPPVPGRPVER